MKPEDFMPRLAFIRYLCMTGIEQSRRHRPLKAVYKGSTATAASLVTPGEVR
jgi:hypothetical protein